MKRRAAALVLSALVLLPPGLGRAQEPTADDIMGGFDDSAPVESTGATPSPSSAPSPWDVSGSVTGSAAYDIDQPTPSPGGRDKRGLSRARTKLNVTAQGAMSEDWRVQADGYISYDGVYRLRGRGGFEEPVVHDQQIENQLGEAYVQGTAAPSLDLKLGRQIAVWGKSDTLRVVDVLNPLDQRETGMVDVQDLRQALLMGRADYYAGPWALTGLVIPDIRFDRLPKLGSGYHIPSYASGPEDVPDSGLKNPEWAASLAGTFTGWDAAFYLAEHYRDTATKYGTMFRHDRLRMLGGAVNVAQGNWLLKGEAAMQDGIRFAARARDAYTRGDVLLGLDYSGFSDVTVTFEVADRHLFGYDAALDAAGAQRDDWSSALRVTGDFMHDRLHLTGLTALSGLAAQGGGYARFSAGYDLLDALTLTGGAVVYMGGKRLPFSAWEPNDRLFADLKWSF